MARLKRIVCYAVNGSGMGHITRLLGVARWMRRYVSLLEGQVPEIIFLTSSEATGVLLQAGFASFKLPSKTVVRQTGMDMLEYRRLARQFVWQTLGLFQPDLLVVDTFPAGSFDELLQLLDGPFRKGFIHRRVKPQYAQRPIFQAALRLYDTIAVPHTQTDDDPDQFAGRPTTWCGEVIQFDRAEAPQQHWAREQLGVSPNDKLIYVSAGGGGDPHSQQALQTIVQTLGQQGGIHLLVGAGPLYQGKRLSGPRLTWFTQPRIFPFLAGCDAAISAGGYNTFHELLHLGIPTVFYAQQKVADDQALRIQQAAAQNACLWLPDVHNADALNQTLNQALQNAPQLTHNAQKRVPGHGAANCARALLSSHYTNDQLAWASTLLSPKVAVAFEDHGQHGHQALARWLPKMVPLPHLDPLANRPGFKALMKQLSGKARREVEGLLDASADTAALTQVKGALTNMLGAAHNHEGGLDALTSLVEVTMKKHPIKQEGPLEGGWLAWIARILAHAHWLITTNTPPLTTQQTLRLYRIFPKLIDADLATSAQHFQALLDAIAAGNHNVEDTVQELRVIKFTHKRVTADVMASFIARQNTLEAP